MRKKFSAICALIVFFLCLSGNSFAQYDTYDDVLLFQSFFRDVRVTPTPYGEAFYTYDNYDFLDITTAGAQVGYPLTDDIEVASGVYYITRHPDEVDGEKGIADVPVYVRYKLLDGRTKLSGGVFATIPVGSEDIGEGNLNFGPFLAFRHPASETVALTGTLGVDLLDTEIEDYEASMNFGGGVIYRARENLHILGEIKVKSDLDYSALSGGLDYRIFDPVRLRANLLLGLDEAAPDFGLRGGIMVIP